MVGSDKKLLKNTDGITLLFHWVLKMEKLQLNKRFFFEFFLRSSIKNPILNNHSSFKKILKIVLFQILVHVHCSILTI